MSAGTVITDLLAWPGTAPAVTAIVVGAFGVLAARSQPRGDRQVSTRAEQQERIETLEERLDRKDQLLDDVRRDHQSCEERCNELERSNRNLLRELNELTIKFQRAIGRIEQLERYISKKDVPDDATGWAS